VTVNDILTAGVSLRYGRYADVGRRRNTSRMVTRSRFVAEGQGGLMGVCRRISFVAALGVLFAATLATEARGAATTDQQVLTYQECADVGGANNFCIQGTTVIQNVFTPGHGGSSGNWISVVVGHTRRVTTGPVPVDSCSVSDDHMNREVRLIQQFSTQEWDAAISSSFTFKCSGEGTLSFTCTGTSQLHFANGTYQYSRSDYECKNIP
jgi:hypothetical protein